jgi:hypothetical protein
MSLDDVVRGLTEMLETQDNYRPDSREARSLRAALDALAGTSQARFDAAHDLSVCHEHIAVLEAQLARVREVIDHPRLGGVRDEHTVTVGEIRAALVGQSCPECSDRPGHIAIDGHEVPCKACGRTYVPRTKEQP